MHQYILKIMWYTKLPALEIIHHISTVRDFRRTVKSDVRVMSKIHEFLLNHYK